MVAAVAALFTLVAMILEVIVQHKKDKNAREAKTYANDLPKFDQALVSRDTALLSAAFDELRLPGATGKGDPGGPDDLGASRR